ncbi:MAG: aminomethyl-transferring glycine dehydrogenase subunit GcvPA [Thermoleophilia bacterium]|nr:aminomethyl-transferring glycine dehydrogenase subunit GcvPA [Thermoleophilia bacterium]
MNRPVHTDDDRRRLLETVGVSDVEELFSPIPPALRREKLDLPAGLTEPETRVRVEALAAMDTLPDSSSFLGAGSYRHFVPAAVRALVSRGEFATAYTPYQPEVSQGTLQHIFEFQTCVCEITGLDVANASMYDGPSAMAEAAFMALRLTRREEILVSDGTHPESARVVDTYAAGPGFPVRRWPLDPETGATVRDSSLLSPAVGAVLVQQPNYLGVVEDISALAVAAHAAGALLVVSVNPSTLGILEAPGRLGADIVVGDAQVFGNAPSFGGPSAGFMACGAAHVRQIPGRLVGQTIDTEGRRCYTLTLQAREQHIRRAKATSSICSNQALSALAATVQLALLGPDGLRERGEICLQRAHHLHAALCALPGVRPFATGPFFHEFALALPCPAADFAPAMRERGVDPGVPLTRLLLGTSAGRSDGETAQDAVLLEHGLLVAVTEVNTPEALDHYVAAARDTVAVLTRGQSKP